MLWISQRQYNQVRLMKNKLLFLTLLCAGNLWADNLFQRKPFTLEYSSANPINQPWQGNGSTTTRIWFREYVWQTDKWMVGKDTEIYTLAEFIKSGKLCEARDGHIWISSRYLNEDGNIVCFGSWEMCAICHRCRQKIKVNKTVEEWEP